MAASLWGKGLYGKGLYSQTQTHDLSGNLRPVVTLSADFDFGTPTIRTLAGALTPQVALSAASLGVTRNLAGSIALATDIEGDLELILGDLVGGVSYTVTFAAALDLVSEPLWQMTTPCDPVDWEESALCNG
jgi:hypothetical protein